MKLKSLAALTIVAGMLGPLARADILEQILVKVNGEIFTKTDLEQRQITYLRQRNRQVSEDDLKNDEELGKLLADITPQLLADALDEILLVQRGRELGYRLSDEQFDNVIENIKKENKIESEEQFQMALRQEGMSMADLRRSLERQMLIGRVQQVEVLNKVGITEVEAREYYQTNPDQFRTRAAVTLREILVSVPVTPGRENVLSVGLDEEAREKVARARVRAQAGEDFAVLAAEVSDAPSKANGGLIGPVERDELAPVVQQQLDAMKVGEVSEVIRTSRGYQLLKLENATPSTLRPFEDVRESIADQVFTQRRRVAMESYLKRLRAQAIIEWKHEELQKAYERHVGLETSPSP